MTPIVIPLHEKGGKFRDDSELRFALRSIAANFTDPHEVVIVGKKLPDWLTGVKHLQQTEAGLKTALRMACEAYPAGFVWFYDDNVILRPTSTEEIKVTPACRGWSKPKTGWARSLEQIHQRLVKEGRPAFDYSRPHGPYWFDKSMVDEAFADWPGMKGKFPWESWILSKRDHPRCHGHVKQYYGAFRGAPASGQRYLNYNDKGFTQELRNHLADCFPDACQYEKFSILERPGKPMKVDVHTIRFGESWWVGACAETLDSWCAKFGHKLKVWSRDDIDPSYPTPKFCEVDMLRDFLAGDAEWLLYVDADVWVAPDAPHHPRFQGKSGFLIRPDRPSKFSRHFPKWARAKFRDGRGLESQWTYRNAGVWACDRDAARRMLEVIALPYHECVQEQHHWNWWLCLAAAGGMKVSDLPDQWNAWPSENNKASFYHLCGQKKSIKFNSLVERGLIIRTPKMPPSFTPSFNYEKYRFAHCGTHMPMDELHIQMLHKLTTIETGTPPDQKIAVEIGSYQGASTAAFIEALNQGLIGHLHVVEVRPTETLRQILQMASDQSRITLHTKPFWDTDIGPADIVFIDGDHKWPAIGDALRAITWGAKIIAMHDSQSWPEIPGTWGAKLASGCIRDMPSRQVFEDAEQRNGMKTQRGFFVSADLEIDLSPLESITEITSPSPTCMAAC